MTIRSLFTHHPASLGETYAEHMQASLGYAVPLFRALLENPDIQNGDYSIHWLERWLARLADPNS